MSLSGKGKLTTERTLANNNFWPDITVGELTEKYRVPTEYADEVISTALKVALITVNQKLEVAHQAILSLGYNSLENYALANSNAIDDEETLMILYTHSVCCYAKAFLLNQSHTIQRLPTTGNAAKDVLQSDNFWLLQAQLGMDTVLATVLSMPASDPNFMTVLLL